LDPLCNPVVFRTEWKVRNLNPRYLPDRLGETMPSWAQISPTFTANPKGQNIPPGHLTRQ